MIGLRRLFFFLATVNPSREWRMMGFRLGVGFFRLPGGLDFTIGSPSPTS
jgi:hypothetical protein